MEIKKLLGHRIYIDIPKKENSKIMVDENTKEALNKELVQKMAKLTVYAVGGDISDIKEGDNVLVDPSSLSKALIVPLSKDKDVLLVSYFDIIHIW
jgi:predicted transcriptional regulator